ncbi:MULTISPECIES: hypothetical protein [unclassified Polaromonas]|uniref:hypothetical protein n=1 Tax=unclassified Polaromonas TaxID=2638319 RepID=UPI000F087B4F|nr:MULTISPECIES: hypothetical protein [unclassified Polaromonas]AYQ26978.1 hypothetical protein DT070_02365 [Polaromonas sp. SP1]QGJ18177.1 hypothetical protein F7R28_07065 [Polaromonas sp. Pch-P]
MQRPTAHFRRAALHSSCLAALLALTLLPAPSYAFWGLLGKVGSTAGKGAAAAGAAGKGAAGAAGVAGAVEVTQGANAAAKAAKAAGAAELGAGDVAAAAGAAERNAAAGAMSADELSRASGLGKAVPDDIAAMLTAPGRKLSDVPDAGTRSWLSLPRKQLTATDADLMVHDYVKLLEGRPAAGPPRRRASASIETEKALAARPVPPHRPVADVPWHAVELLVRAAHAGHVGARNELNKLCRENPRGEAAAACTTLRST